MYPEHEKRDAVKAEWLAVRDFIASLHEQGIYLAAVHEHTDLCYDREDRCRFCGYGDHDYVPIYGLAVRDKINEFFGLSEATLEEERQAMLDSLRDEMET